MRAFIFAMLALLILSGVGAWLLFADGETDSGASMGQASVSTLRQRQEREAEKRKLREAKKLEREESAQAEALLREAGADPSADGEGGKTETVRVNRGVNSSDAGASTDASQANAKGASIGEVKIPNKSASQKATLIDTLAFIAAGKEAEEVAKDELEVLASKKWTAARIAKRFANRGAEEPKRILTELSGKIMVLGVNSGLPGARVILHSFFPEHNRPTDQLIPVITEFTTDEKGFFNGMVPLPERFPETHAVLTITVISGAEGGNPDVKIAAPASGSNALWQMNGQSALMDGTYGAGKPLIVGKALTEVVAGKKAALGIFWVSEHTVNLRLDGTAFSEKDKESATVSMLGHCDPKRWTEDTRRETLATFPSRTLSLKSMQVVTGVADPYGGWLYDGPPVMALHRDGELLSTQRAKVTKKDVEKPEERTGVVSPLDGKTYILDVFFDGGSGTSISGYVQTAEELGIAGARVYFGGKSVDSVITDAAGWFFLGNAPTETTLVVVEHSDYAPRWIKIEDFRKANDIVTMADIRPRVTLQVLDEATRLPLASVRANFNFKNVFNQAKKGEMDLPKVGDAFLFEWQDPITGKVELSAIGYSPIQITLPPKNDPGVMEVLMRERRRIDVPPNVFSEAESRGDAKWFTFSDGDDDVYTAWSHLDLSYDVNFSKDVNYDVEEIATPFEFVLGLRNQGIVDNVYNFEVEVLVDGKSKGKLKIRADTLNERTGAINLGKLKGQHRITLRWLNDKWIPNELDANIRVTSLRFLELP